jgi:hypothetical protein
VSWVNRELGNSPPDLLTQDKESNSMAKKNRKKIAAYTRDETRERSRSYTASSGLEVILTGLPPLAPQRIDASIEYPSKPTYTVETASGDTEIYEHDKESLTTDEDKEAWADYLEASSDAETELTEKLLYAVLLDCVELKDFEEEFTHWKFNQKLIGISIAEGEEGDEKSLEEADRENKFYFMQTEVFRDSDDIGEILTIVMSLTGVSVEDLVEARDSFPGEVESESPAGNGDTAGQPEDPEE